MKVSVLCHDLSNNCLGRAYLLGKILQRRYEVEIVGPLFGEDIWEPVANDKTMIFKQVQFRRKFQPWLKMCELLKQIDGDVIYASKPLFTSFFLGLIKKKMSGKPLVLDIDDWEMGFVKNSFARLSPYSRFKSLVYSAVFPYLNGSYLGTLACERLIYAADAITASNKYLQAKYNATILPHGRDTVAFDPTNFNRSAIRERHNIGQGQKVVMFLGTPRPHKGLEDLVKAMALIKDESLLLVIVGMNADSYSVELADYAKKTLHDRLRVYGLQSFNKVPEFLSLADLVVIPQRKSIATLGQVPAKVFDAMAMAKPIISTDVSDLPDILEGCGWIVKPTDVEELKNAIQYVVSHPEEAEKAGMKARLKCTEVYSWKAMDKTLSEVFRKFEKAA
jgi:glycosyltransferase involved in cell wall biosynthesis